jgi:hypothetical protein
MLAMVIIADAATSIEFKPERHDPPPEVKTDRASDGRVAELRTIQKNVLDRNLEVQAFMAPQALLD